MTAQPTRARRLMITAFGWNDPGGGTTVPRLTAKELARRGWEVSVFHAAAQPTASGVPYEVVEWEQDGVRLLGVHNRPHLLFDMGNPLREIDDPPITTAFAAALDRLTPDVVHFHNLHNLGAALIDQAAARGLPAFFTTHNYWLICPRAYLLTGQGQICSGPGDGSRCATCVGSIDLGSHSHRLAAIRAHAESGLTRILAVSTAVRETLLGAGYDGHAIDVVRQAMPHDQEIWASVGAERVPGRLRERLTVAFVGSAYPHKGPQMLVEAAQRTRAEVDVRIIGEIRDEFAHHLRVSDTRGVVKFHGSFDPAELDTLLADVDVAVLPSMWWDCAPLAAAECLAARIPLLVPRLGGLPEAVRDEIDGLVFDGLATDDLAEKLDRLASEPGLLERLQERIEAPRAFSAYVDELEAYYNGEHPQLLAAERGIAVRWQGDFGIPTSLSIINDRITERLDQANERADRDGLRLSAPIPHPANVEVHHQWPPDLSTPGSGALAAIVPWEFGSIPRAWIEQIRSDVDELWVPSEYVRAMYVEDGVEPERVRVIPNGVDLETFNPASPADELSGGAGARFLFVGGITHRKGLDILIQAWDRAFAGREDVSLVVKAAMAAGAYGGPNQWLRERAASDRLPLVKLIEDDLDGAQLATLYRSCDVFVLPYRGEGFAMPVLEAMASGLPIIATAGGPTDEFCPEDACWRIRSERRELSREQLPGFDTAGRPWMLEPDVDHLVELLRQAESDPEARARRGQAARRAAEALPWDHAADLYRNRIDALARRRPRRSCRVESELALSADAAVRVFATPAWHGTDRLPDLLAAWQACTTPATGACLYLLADPDVAGDQEQIEGRILEAAATAAADLDSCADIDALIMPFHALRDRSLHAAMSAYVPLHPGCDGQIRIASSVGSEIIEPTARDLAELLRG